MRTAALVLLASIDAAAAGTHCLPTETVAFSCAVSASKVVSVCSAQGSGIGPPAVSYRFGRLGAPELVFPSSAVGSAQKFRYAHYSRFQIDRTELNFSSAGADYTVFDYYDGEQTPIFERGVGISMNGTQRGYPCRDAVLSHLIELENVVTCDAENALANCR